MKKSDKIFTALVCLFFLGMSLLYLVLPKREFSPLEKRYLTQAPTLTARSLLSGDFGDEVEDYLADQMPGRDLFVGLNAYYERALGLQKSKDIWVLDGKLVRRPVTAKEDTIARRAAGISDIIQAGHTAVCPACFFIWPRNTWRPQPGRTGPPSHRAPAAGASGAYT